MLKLSFERAHMFNRHLFPCAPLVCLPFVSLVGELRCEESSPGRKSIPREGTADEVAQRLRTHGVGKAPGQEAEDLAGAPGKLLFCPGLAFLS